MLYLIVAALGVVLDQIVKAFIRAELAIGETMPFLPGILRLTHFENSGAAFSMLSGGWARWLLAALSLGFVIVGCVIILKKKLPHRFALWSLAAIVSGAAGNLIDRVWQGTVTDMFQTEFMNFAVFNVADAFVVCGGIALCIYVLMHWKDEELSKEKAHESDNDPL